MQFLVLMYRSILINLRDGANCWMLLIIGAAVAAIAALMFRYIESSDFLFLRNAYFLGCFYVVDLPSFSLHRWYTDVEFFRYPIFSFSHSCVRARCQLEVALAHTSLTDTNSTTATTAYSRCSSPRRS
jgi:hypothetical protein